MTKISLEPLKLVLAEVRYCISLRLLSEPEKNREGIARIVRVWGRDVEPDDFLGARLLTGPENREYLKDRYGVTFYPSTIYIPGKIWSPPEYGGKGLVSRLAPDIPLNRPGGWRVGGLYCHAPDNFSIALKFVTSTRITFHEDFHERFYLTRGNERGIEERVISELHSFHSDLDEGLYKPGVLKDWLRNYCFPEFGVQVASIIDLLPRLEKTIGDKGIEKLLLTAPSLDYILEQAKA